MLDEIAQRWIYALEAHCVFLDSSDIEMAKRIAAEIDQALDSDELRSVPQYEVFVALLDHSEAVSLEGAPTAVFIIAGIDGAKADSIAKQLASHIAEKAGDAAATWTITALPEFDTELTPMSLAFGVNESALLAPNSLDIDGAAADMGSAISTTSDLVNFHILAATIGDPGLSLLDMEFLTEQLFERSDFADEREPASDTTPTTTA